MARMDSSHSMFTDGRNAEEIGAQEEEIIVKTKADRPSGAQHLWQGFGAWLTLALLVGGLLLPALAAEPAAARPNGSAGKHCVVQAVERGVKAQARSPKPECYRTFAKAQAAAMGGEEGGFHSAGASRSLIGIFYDSTFYSKSGGTLSVFVIDRNGCSDGTVYEYVTMPSGWDNRISSAKTYTGCRVAYFTQASFGGTPLNGTVASDYDINNFENLSNTTSSVRWSQA